MGVLITNSELPHRHDNNFILGLHRCRDESTFHPKDREVGGRNDMSGVYKPQSMLFILIQKKDKKVKESLFLM